MTAGHRCERGPHCLAAVRDVDELVAAECDRALCDVCTAAVARALDEVPGLYVALRRKTLDKDTGAPSEQVSVSKGSPMPVNARALHLTEQVHWLLTTWEDEIRSVASLSYPVREGKREGRQVQDAARLLVAHLSAWIAAPVTEFATSRWTSDVVMSGSEGASQLLDWRAAVRAVPGLAMDGPRAKRRYGTPCPSCQVRAVVHYAGDDLMYCEHCGAYSPYLEELPELSQEAAS